MYAKFLVVTTIVLVPVAFGMTDRMQRIDVSLVDAFTADPLTGNAAGVVTEADDLTDEQLQAIARELSVSETAFLTESDAADRAIRYFTPTQEIDLCGHATVAAHARLFEEGVIDAGTHTLETNVGVLEIEVTDEGVVWMSGETPTVELLEIDYDRLADALGIEPIALSEPGVELPLAVASTGTPFLMVPVTYLQRLLNVSPDANAVTALCEEFDATGIYAFTFDTLDPDASLHARAFAPRVGIPEDPVTGTAAGGAAAYIRQTGAFGDELGDELVFEQGHAIDRPGTVTARLNGEIRVGGRAVTSLDGSLLVPPLDEDEIVEA